MAPQVELVAAAGSGRNALDFMVAFHAGRIIERNPNAVIHILSKDKGFDPLIRHLNDSGRTANRYDNFSAIPVAGIQKAIRTNPERRCRKKLHQLPICDKPDIQIASKNITGRHRKA
jgi:hypothetical protein